MGIPKVVRPVRVRLLVKEPLYHLFIFAFPKFMDETLCVFTEIVSDADLVIITNPWFDKRSQFKGMRSVSVSLTDFGHRVHHEEELALNLVELIHGVMKHVREKHGALLPPEDQF